jgi:hypothetical protein
MESGKASRPLLFHCWYMTPHKLTLRSCCCYSLCTACCADIAYILSTAAASRRQRCYGDALKTAAIKATKKRQPTCCQPRCLCSTAACYYNTHTTPDLSGSTRGAALACWRWQPGVQETAADTATAAAVPAPKRLLALPAAAATEEDAD